jgi:hypothetical protein
MYVKSVAINLCLSPHPQLLRGPSVPRWSTGLPRRLRQQILGGRWQVRLLLPHAPSMQAGQGLHGPHSDCTGRLSQLRFFNSLAQLPRLALITALSSRESLPTRPPTISPALRPPPAKLNVQGDPSRHRVFPVRRRGPAQESERRRRLDLFPQPRLPSSTPSCQLPLSSTTTSFFDSALSAPSFLNHHFLLRLRPVDSQKPTPLPRTIPQIRLRSSLSGTELSATEAHTTTPHHPPDSTLLLFRLRPIDSQKPTPLLRTIP